MIDSTKQSIEWIKPIKGNEQYWITNTGAIWSTISNIWLKPIKEGGNINYDGKYWVAQCTYIWSPDPNRWQTDIYDVADDGYGANFTKNSIFNFS